LKVIPKPDQHGNVIIYISANDLKHNVVTTSQLEITINSVNDPPELKNPFDKMFFLGELHIQEDGSYVTFDLNDVFWDPIEKDPLKFTFTGNRDIKVNINETDYANITILTNWSGVEKVTFSASDGQASISDSLTIIVDSKNDPPIINNTPNKRVYENQWCNFTIEAYDPDPGDTLLYSTNILEMIPNLKEDKFFFDRNTGTVSFLTDYLIIGNYDIVISVSDSIGASTDITIVIEIMNVLDPPIPYIDEPKAYGAKLVFPDTHAIDFIGHADDPDLLIPNPKEPEILSYKWRSNIDGLFGDNPTTDNVLLSQGDHTITFEVDDGTYIRTTTLLVTIEEGEIDSDNDGMPDWWEENYALDPRDPQDADKDPDQDGFSNYLEYLGRDGKPGGGDDTDPNLITDAPENVEIEEKDEGIDIEIIIAIVVILVIIFIIGVVGYMYYHNIKKAETEALELREKQKLAEVEAAKKALEDEEAQRGGWGKYQPKFNEKDVLCCGCGTALDVNSVVRPLALVCSQCGLKSVIYRR
jgi:hypothetical protein